MVSRKLIPLILWVLVLSKCSKGKRIAGASSAKQGQFPYFAYITSPIQINGRNRTKLCGATLIHPMWIISAAHCFSFISSEIKPFKLEQQYKVYMGNIVTFDPASDMNEIDKVIVHPRYVFEFVDEDPRTQEERRLENDVAVARLRREYTLNENVYPIQLPHRRNIDDNLTDRCTTGVAIGVGSTGFNNGYSKKVLYSELDALNPLELANPKPKPCVNSIFYSEIVDKNQKGQPLHGDSGGPFVCHALNKSYKDHVLYGVISTIYNNTINGTAITAFEAVDKHMDFILPQLQGEKVSRIRMIRTTSGSTNSVCSVLFASTSAAYCLIKSVA